MIEQVECSRGESRAPEEANMILHIFSALIQEVLIQASVHMRRIKGRQGNQVCRRTKKISNHCNRLMVS